MAGIELDPKGLKAAGAVLEKLFGSDVPVKDRAAPAVRAYLEAVRPNMAMVPVEATQEMVQAALDCESGAGLVVGNPDVRLGFYSAYRAMVAAALSERRD